MRSAPSTYGSGAKRAFRRIFLRASSRAEEGGGSSAADLPAARVEPVDLREALRHFELEQLRSRRD